MFEEKRKAKTGSMIQTRLLLGSLSICHGCAGMYVTHDVGLSWLRRTIDMGWVIPFLLAFFGAVMVVAAIGEMLNHSGRLCRGVSAMMLWAMWLVSWVLSFSGGVDYVTFMAPIYLVFITWAAIAEARMARHRAIYQKSGVFSQLLS